MDKAVPMKIFVSYSRRDAGDFADHIQKHIGSFMYYDVFTDEKSIGPGDIWSDVIETNISKCNVFVAIVTYGALQSPHVENEVLQAQREKKKIIPCFHRTVSKEDVKWGLTKIQGVVFTDKYDLARDLHSKITKVQRDSRTIIDDNFKPPEVKSRWREPVVLVPIIVAVIIAIVGPIIIPMIQDLQKQSSSEPPVVDEPPATPQTNSDSIPSGANITVRTDKQSYVPGEIIRISGNVSKVEEGNSVRIDIRNPENRILEAANGIETEPNRRGFYHYELNPVLANYTDPSLASRDMIPGEYRVLIAYLNQSAEDKFIIE